MDTTRQKEPRPYAGKSFEQLVALAERVESQRVELAREQELIRDELRFRNLTVNGQPDLAPLSLPSLPVGLAYATPPLPMIRDDRPGDPYVAAARRSGIANGIIATTILLVALLIFSIIGVAAS